MENLYCPQCGKPNPADAAFCQFCRFALAEHRDLATAPAGPGQVQTGVASEGAAPIVGAAPQASPIGQMGQGGLSALDIWGPFAGYGDRGRHVSWLLDNLGERAEDLRDAVTRRFQERQIPDGRVQPKVLQGRGILVERRDYHLIRRGVATAGVYIARFGQDLFISQVTYAKGPINPLRVLILALSLLFQLFLMFGYGQAIESSLGSISIFGGYGGDTGALSTLLCCVGPLGLLNALGLAIAGVHMIYKFLTVKDPLMLLRTPPNEFQQDDIVALEKAVEETVRQSLDRVGIDTGVMPPASDYGVKRRLI